MLTYLFFALLNASNSYLSPQISLVSQQDRILRNHHHAGVLWFTGLSGSGKSTLAKNLEASLFKEGYQVCIIDGDTFRSQFSKDLGFTEEDRSRNIERAGCVSKMFCDTGFLVIASFISPYQKDRNGVQNLIGTDFHEIYIKASLDLCIQRDPKGFYQKALNGEIKNYTGVSSAYEIPEKPSLTVDTEKSQATCLESLLDFVHIYFPKGDM